MPPCVYCGRPPVLSISGQNLCVDHAAMATNVINTQQAQNMAMMNYLHDHMEYTMGLSSTPPRINIPQQIVHQGHINHTTNNHINIDRSIVGAVNTAQAAQISVAMENINKQGNQELAATIKELTEAIASHVELSDAAKQGAVESLTFLSQQATQPPERRQPSIIKQTLKSIREALGTAADLTELWTKHSVIILEFFRLTG